MRDSNDEDAEYTLEWVAVTVVKHLGKACVVSYVRDGREERCVLPTSLLETGSVSRPVLEEGIPYGIPWARACPLPSFTPEALETALHNAGIWTLEDLRQHSQAALGAIQAAYHFDLAALLTAATKFAESGALSAQNKED